VPTITLDEFAETLLNSMAAAQASVERTNRGRLEHLVQLASDGRSEALTWSFVIDGPNRRTLRLPLITLFPPMAVRVTEAKLDLNVAVQRAPVLRKNKSAGRVRLKICRRAASLRHRLHQLTVRLTGTQDAAAEISLDGVHLKTVHVDPQARELVSSHVG
jgi:hypothetical protein